MHRQDKLTLTFVGLFVLAAIVITIMVMRLQHAEKADAKGPGITGIEHFQTENGMSVYYLYAPELPMVDIRLMLDAGSRHDGDSAGLAALTNAMLEQGTKQKTVDELAEGLANVGAQLNSGVAEDYAFLGLRSLTEDTKLLPALALYYEILASPSFPEQNFKQQRDQQLQGIKLQHQRPGAIAQQAFSALLYPAHPYGQPIDGDEATVAKLSVKQLQQFYRARYGLNGSVIAVVGAIEREQVNDIAAKVGQILRQNNAKPIQFPEPKMSQVAARSIPFPSQQTHILVGALGVKRGDEDYFPLYVGNHILGGDSISELFKHVREEKGLAYSIYSYFKPMQQKGAFVIGLQTRNAEKEKALKVVRNILQEYIEKGPSGKQLIEAKNYITGNFALRINSNTNMIRYLAMMGYYDLPTDYLATFAQNVENVTLAQVQDAFRRRLNPDQMVTVTVGA